MLKIGKLKKRKKSAKQKANRQRGRKWCESVSSDWAKKIESAKDVSEKQSRAEENWEISQKLLRKNSSEMAGI